jgi:BASS family bile acid:Na+ symporter
MRILQQLALAVAVVGLIVVVAGIVAGNPNIWQPAAVATSVAVAIGLGAWPDLRTYRFTAWILAGAIAAMIYPSHLLHVGPVDLRNKYLILLIMQLVMFGMGTQMKLRDFAGVARMPYPALIGIGLQFTVMPLVGFALASTLGFSPEVAAGIVLIGSCSSGLASNVMTFIARANLPLSITLTSLATMLAPLMTPMWMKVLAGRMIEVDAVAMMMEIVKLIIVPIGAAMLDDFLNHTTRRARRIVYAAGALAAVVLLAGALGGWQLLANHFSGNALTAFGVGGFLLGAIVVGIFYHELRRILPQVESLMPIFSMLGIVYVTTVTVAAGRDRLLVIGPLLLVAVITHNSLGYLLGYWLSRAFRLDENDARTVALEVGLQNGGMATTIAAAMNQLATLGLAAAVFNPWMNFSGSILANYWRRRPLIDNDRPTPDHDSTSPNKSL